MGPAPGSVVFWTKEVKVVLPCALIVLTFLFGTLVNLISELPPHPLLGDPHPIPRSSLSFPQWNLRNMPDPAEFQVLGNASGEQYLAILTSSGSLVIYVSNDCFFKNVSYSILELSYVTDTAGVDLRLGRDAVGRVAVSISRNDDVKGWTLEEWPDRWVPMLDPSEVTAPSSPLIDPTSLPYPDNVRDWATGWDTLVMEGRDVAVGTYRYQNGCSEAACSPSVVFRKDDGEWSTIVVLGSQWVDKVRADGTGFDNVFVVSANLKKSGATWYITKVDGDGILDVGQVPPVHDAD